MRWRVKQGGGEEGKATSVYERGVYSQGNSPLSSPHHLHPNRSKRRPPIPRDESWAPARQRVNSASSQVPSKRVPVCKLLGGHDMRRAPPSNASGSWAPLAAGLGQAATSTSRASAVAIGTRWVQRSQDLSVAGILAWHVVQRELAKEMPKGTCAFAGEHRARLPTPELPTDLPRTHPTPGATWLMKEDGKMAAISNGGEVRVVGNARS